jgi:hypothetical protein
MRNISIDFTGTLIATVTPDEFRHSNREFWHDGDHYEIKRMQGNKDGSITIEARKTASPDSRDTLVEYPMYTRFSPTGKIENRKGKKKLKATDPKPYQPLKGDTETGKGERRKRYIS